MNKFVLSLIVAVLIASMVVTPGQIVSAQTISLPAEINKSFSPISIPSGGISRLSVSVFNPNPFPLTDASWTDVLNGVQPGLTIADPVGMTNSCGGLVNAGVGATSLSLSGGTVPAQTGTTPGSCTVSINVTSTVPGNIINTIPARALSSTGGGTTVTNTSPSSATLHIGGTQNPSVSKSFSPGTIWAGGTSRLTIVITNNSASTTLTQAALSDPLPANVFLADPVSPTLTGCGGGATVNAVAGGTSVTLNNGSIAPVSTCTITVNVTSNTQGAYTNTIPANGLRTQQGLTNTTPASTRLNVQQIGMTKRFSPGTVSAGGTTTLTITLQNPTSSPYTGARFVDNLPSLLVVDSVTNNSCGGTVSTTPSNTISLTGGTIPPGSATTPGICAISVLVLVPAGTPSGPLVNTIPRGTLVTDQGVGNLRAASASVTVSGTDVAGIKSFTPSTITAGGNSRLRIDIFAPSDTDLTNVSTTDDLPANVTVSNSTPLAVSGCGASAVLTADTGATSISLTGGVIPAGQRCRIDVYVTSNVPSPPGAPYINTIPPQNITNAENRTLANALTGSLTVNRAGNVSIALVKGFDPLTVFGGSASTMSVELINPGTVTLTGIAFTDSMPAGMFLANPVNFNVGSCGGTLTGNPGDQTFAFSGGTLPPLSNCTLTLSASMRVNGNLTNTIPAGAVTTAEGVTNADPAEASLTDLPGVSLGKFFLPNPIVTGSYSLLTITINNTGDIGLTRMGLSDSLPTGLSIAGGTAPAPVNNCGGSLTAVSGTQLIELTGGSLAGSASCTIEVPVTGSTAGSYQNSIPPGSLTTTPSVTNSLGATDTLVIVSESEGEATAGRGGGRRRSNTTVINPPATGFFIPVTGFAPGMVTQLDSSLRPAYEATSLTIEIPVIKIKTPIVGVESRKGRWDVSWLQDQVGWLNGTAYPTWKGNSVLTGHATNADGKPGVFSRLKALGLGEYIFVYNMGYRYTYKVISNTYVQPNDSSVMKHQEEPYLTLITCDQYDEKTSTYLRRVAVSAVLVDVKETK